MSAETADAQPMARVNEDHFKKGMRRLLSGVCLVTAEWQGEWVGMIATSVTSVTMEPPSLLVCVDQSASSHAPLSASGAFCVNILGRDAHPVADRFVSGVERSRRFQEGEWRALTTGAPSLAGALAAFDCVVRKQIPFGTHTIFLGEIVNLNLDEIDPDPLLYLEGGFRSLHGGRIGG